MIDFITGDDGRSIVISGQHTVLLIGDEMTPQQAGRVREMLAHTEFTDALQLLQAPEGPGLSHYALLAVRDGAIGEFAVSTGGRLSAMVWRGSPAAARQHATGGDNSEPTRPIFDEPSNVHQEEALQESEQQTNEFDRLFEHTRFFGVEDAAVRLSEAAPEPEAAPDYAHAAPVQASHTPLSLVLPDNTRRRLELPVLIGRRPEVPHDFDPRDFHIVTIADRRSGLSRLHARIDQVGQAAMVTDLGSTNGTALISPAGEVTNLPPHTPHRLLPGGRIILGSITLELAQ